MCGVKDCNREIASVGVCWQHYQAAYRLRKTSKLPDNLDPALLAVIQKPNKPKPRCSICGLDVHAKNLCKTHYNRGLRKASDYSDSELMNQLRGYAQELTQSGLKKEALAVNQFIRRMTNV